MRKLFLGVLAVGALVFGFWLVLKLFPSDEKVIRQRLDKLAQAASFGANESPLSRLASASKVAGFFTADVALHIEALGAETRDVAGRDELQQGVLGARSTLGSLTIKFLDTQVEVSPDRQSATALLTAQVNTPNDPNFGVQEVKLTWKKVEREWLISQVETVKTLKR